MTCFITCAGEDNTNEGEKKSCRVSFRRMLNTFRQSEDCSVSCMGENVKGGRKRLCVVSFFVSLRNRFMCTYGGGE